MSIQETKARVARAALEVFTAKGYAAASMREIAELGGLTKPTLYYYFGSKEGLYRSLVVDNLVELNHRLARAASGEVDPREKLLAFVELFFEFCRESPALLKLAFMAIYRCDSFAPEIPMNEVGKNTLDILAGIFQDGVERGLFRALPARPAALLLLGAVQLQALVILKNLPGSNLNSPEEIVSSFLRGWEKP